MLLEVLARCGLRRGAGAPGQRKQQAQHSTIRATEGIARIAGGAIAHADAVLLNLPRAAIERLDPASVLFVPDHSDLSVQILRNCTPCQGPGGAVETHLDVKVYAIYDDPWWLTKLHILEGTFNATEADPVLVGRYHDGPVRHGPSGDIVGPGALEVV